MRIGNGSRRSIALLRDDLARKIAAGEVIDRPNSVVRELIDNSIDSGADRVNLHLLEGGLSSIEVTDNGSGMSQEDLSLCYLPHATSKIHEEEDLLAIRTLGFRGEALSSISSVSRMSITSRSEDSDSGYQLRMEAGSEPRIQAHPWDRGTRVSVKDLFYNLPARKRFLKRASTEAKLARQTFIEKALPFPGIQFSYTNEQGQALFFPALSGDRALAGRVLAAFPEQTEPSLLQHLQGSGTDFRFDLVLGDPGLQRSDRRMIYVFANRRRIQEFSLVHAIEHSFQGFLPGGRYPIAFLFLDVDPDSVDFNIHPAKREARFRNMQEIHHRINRSVQEQLFGSARKTLASQQRANIQLALDTPSPVKPGSRIQGRPSHNWRPLADQKGSFDLSVRFDAASLAAEGKTENDSGQDPVEFRYLGQVFNLFLVAEYQDRLLLVDMHAAHEKILYDALRAKPKVQRLLIPLELELETDPDDPKLLLASLSSLGFEAEIEGPRLRIKEMPQGLSGKEKLVLKFLQEFDGNASRMEQDLYANAACRSAVMDGDQLSPGEARTLISKVLLMENPRCPHGRPIWFELSREELFSFVGRT